MKPVPWFWLARLACVFVGVIAWELTYPHTPFWQLFLIGAGTSIAVEGLRWGYRQEQAEIRNRRRRNGELS